MSIKIKVTMTEKRMYDFMLYHTYTHMSGLVGAMLGVVGLGIGIQCLFQNDVQSAAMGFLVAVLFLVVNPVTMRQRAKAQVDKNVMFQKPLEYEFTEEGIVVRQEDQEALTKWEDFEKAVSTGRSIILYVTRLRAFILPKECMGDQYEPIMKCIHTHMPAKKVRIRHIR